MLPSLHRGRYDAGVTTLWTEVGDRVFVRRYRFFDQDIVAVLGGGRGADRGHAIHARRRPARSSTTCGSSARPRVGIVVNTHGHCDHSFGNAVFRPAVIWGHERCVTMIRTTGEAQRASAAEEFPDIAADLAEVVLDPPDRTFTDRARRSTSTGARSSSPTSGAATPTTTSWSRSPTPTSCAPVTCVENGAPPWFGDGYPDGLAGDGRGAARRSSATRTVVVPGMAPMRDRAFVERSLAEIRAIADLALTVQRGEASLDDAVAAAPYPAAAAREPIERALAQLRGELRPDAPRRRA